MPPHCDTMDGPVVKAAKRALQTGNVNLILPWAYKKAEAEIRNAFERAMHVRKLGRRQLNLQITGSLRHWCASTGKVKVRHIPD